MRKFMGIVLSVLLMASICAGYTDSRVAYSIPMLPPDPSLKTTDPFYGGMGAQMVGNYALPAIFGGPVVGDEGLKATKTNTKSLISFSNVSSYDLSEEEMIRANITIGQESWL
jgi:hypothetical protein